MHLPPDTSLAAKVAELERQVADLRQTGSRVYDPTTGTFVALSSLAFGQVVAENAVVGAVNLTSVASTASPSATDPNNWTYIAPTLDVYVGSGRMRVDFAAVLACNANTTAIPEIDMSYRALYRGPVNDGSVNTLAVSPSRYRCIKLVNYAGSAQVLSYGSFGFHAGLTPGWYRVQPAFFLIYASAPTVVLASADYPRIAVTPL